MAVDKFPVEGSHIMMFARSIADDNQIYYDADYAKSTEAGGVIAPPTFAQSSAQFDPTYFCARKSARIGSVQARKPRASRKRSRLVAEAVAAVVCTPSNTSNTTGILAQAMYSPPRLSPVRPGKRKENALASWSSVKRLRSIVTKTENWQSPRAASVFVPSVR